MHFRQANLPSSNQIQGHVADQNYITFIDSPYENWFETKRENNRHEPALHVKYPTRTALLT